MRQTEMAVIYFSSQDLALVGPVAPKALRYALFLTFGIALAPRVEANHWHDISARYEAITGESVDVDQLLQRQPLLKGSPPSHMCDRVVESW